MEETKLIIFRWGAEEYGIPVENVSGIISNAGTNGLSIFENVEGAIHLQGKPIPISDMDGSFNAGGKMSAIIIHLNGIQILITADEVIQERTLMSTESELDATIVPLQIWKFKHGAGSIRGSDESGRV